MTIVIYVETTEPLQILRISSPDSIAVKSAYTSSLTQDDTVKTPIQTIISHTSSSTEWPLDVEVALLLIVVIFVGPGRA